MIFYTTKSNKQTKFKIFGKPNTIFKNQKEIQINPKLENEFNNLIILNIIIINNNAYLIQFFEFNQTYKFKLAVNGALSDIVNIDSHFHNGYKYSISQKTLRENCHFIFGYLKEGVNS